jgi:hypothetical protein
MGSLLYGNLIRYKLLEHLCPQISPSQNPEKPLMEGKQKKILGWHANRARKFQFHFSAREPGENPKESGSNAWTKKKWLRTKKCFVPILNSLSFDFVSLQRCIISRTQHLTRNILKPKITKQR